jgi:GT2 family glycosyltransferase
LFKHNEPFVSVIILNFNGKRYLGNCLSSVFKTAYGNFEVILVDNASSDKSIEDAQAQFGSDRRLKIVHNTSNLGFSGGNNVGFTHAKGEYVAFLNNDTIVDPNWLRFLVETMQNDHSIGLAQSMILMINGDKIQTAGWLFSDHLVHKYGLAENKNSRLQLKPVFEVSVASGASMMTRRSLIKEIGLFDPAIPFFYDDTLLSFKVWLANKRVVTVSDSKIRHVQGATSTWNVQNTTYNLLKAKICLTFDIYYSLNDLAKAFAVNFFAL